MLLSKDMISSLCEITTLDNELLASGDISEISEKYVEIINPNGKMTEIEKNILVKLIIHNKEYNVYAASVYSSDEKCLKLSGLEDYTNFEKREYFRVNVFMDTRGYFYTGKGDPPYNTKEPFRLNVIDLSLTGLMFNTKTKLEMDQQIGILLPLHEIEIFNCRIKRIIELSNIGGYGCEFIKNTNKQENLLCNFIFEEQRKLIIKKKYSEETEEESEEETKAEE